MALLTGEVDASWKADAADQVAKGADGAALQCVVNLGGEAWPPETWGGGGQAEDLVMPRWGLAVNESEI